MSAAVWGCLIGLALGVPFGFMLCAIFVAEKDADDQTDYYHR